VIFTSLVAVQSIAMYVSVRLSVHLYAHMSQKPHVQISRNFLCMLTLAMAVSSSDDNAICYVLWGFVDDIVFAHNQRRRQQDVLYTESDSPGGSTGQGPMSAIALLLIDVNAVLVLLRR